MVGWSMEQSPLVPRFTLLDLSVIVRGVEYPIGTPNIIIIASAKINNGLLLPFRILYITPIPYRNNMNEGTEM